MVTKVRSGSGVEYSQLSRFVHNKGSKSFAHAIIAWALFEVLYYVVVS